MRLSFWFSLGNQGSDLEAKHDAMLEEIRNYKPREVIHVRHLKNEVTSVLFISRGGGKILRMSISYIIYYTAC